MPRTKGVEIKEVMCFEEGRHVDGGKTQKTTLECSCITFSKKRKQRRKKQKRKKSQ